LLALAPPGESRVLSGVMVDDSTEARLPAAMVMLDDSIRATADENGGFFIENVLPGAHKLTATARGYASENRTIAIETNRSAVMLIRLKANLSGILHDEPIILDAAFGGSETGEVFNNSADAASANFDLAARLADTLRWAGAKVTLVREDQNNLPVQERIAKVNRLLQGWYLKINYRKWDSDSILVQSTIYPANRVGEQIATAINASFIRFPRSRALLRQNASVPEVNLTNKTALEVTIKCRAPMMATRDLPALFEGIVNFKRTSGQETEEQ
jgi:N-acetylmuramoyl-L-alanine amidase